MATGEFSAYKSWTDVLKDQERMLLNVNMSFLEYFDKTGGSISPSLLSDARRRPSGPPATNGPETQFPTSLPLPVAHADLPAHRRTFSEVGLQGMPPVPHSPVRGGSPKGPLAAGRPDSPLDSFRLNGDFDELVDGNASDDDTSVSGLSESCKRDMEFALTAWQEQLRVWIGVVRLNKELPERTALRQLLYGDLNNSAKGADVIVLFLMDLHINKKKGTDDLQHRFKTVVDDPEDYIFNEEDEGLAFPHVPALKVTRSDGIPRYTALYCCVHKRNAGDWERDGNINFLDVFPLPIRLACRATAEEGPEPIDGGDRYIVMQDVVLAKQESFMHLKLMGADLDLSPKAKLLQLQELEREFHAWQRDCQKFAAIIFGNFASRVVVGDDFAGLVVEEERSPKGGKDKKNKAPLPPMFMLSEEGAERLCEAIADPAQRRTLFTKESLCFTGKDALGTFHKSLEKSSKKLRDMFHLHVDLALKDPDFPVPLPTYKRKPMEAILSERLGFKVYTEELITRQQLDKGCAKLRTLDPRTNVEDLYFTSSNRRLRTTLGDALMLQCGWLDGVGVLRHGSVPARLTRFDADASLLAFDHVPVKATVHVFPGGKGPGLRVWVGAIKLDKRYPETSALQHFMYDTPGNSAADADVIALYFTDLHLDEHNVGQIRHLLRNHVRNSDDYVYNEEDPGLQIKNIPAILVKVAEGDPRYVALFACVHKRNVGDLDGNNEANFEDTFPLPASLMCRSHLKNEFSPNFKAHLVQDCLLFHDNMYFHLMLFGLNFDTSNEAQLGQVVAMERCMGALQRDKALFTGIAFGDFNNRLVCTSDLKSAVKLRKNDSGGKPVLVISPPGVEELVRQITDPVLRRELFLTCDSWVWTGVDAVGTEIKAAPLCFRKLSEMFILHRDLVEADANYDLSLPTYKRTPIGDILTRIIGFKLKIGSLLEIQSMLEAFKKVDISETPISAMPPDQVRKMFFGDGAEPIYIDYATQLYPMLDMGWPDGVGVFKSGPLPIRIENWGTADEVLCGEHVPIRCSVIVTLAGSAAKPSLWSMNGRKNPVSSPGKHVNLFAF